MLAVDVLVVDPDQALRRSLVECMGHNGMSVAEADGGVEAFDAVAEKSPAVVVLELCLPDISGYEVCRTLRARAGDSLAILMMSEAKADPLDRSAGMLLGADDFLVKPLDRREFLARLHRSLTRIRASAPSGALRQAHVETPSVNLTKRELDVLHLLAKGMRQPEIAESLVITEKTVSSHIQHILAKIGAHSRAEAVSAAFRLGLVGVGPDAAHSPGFRDAGHRLVAAPRSSSPPITSVPRLG